jgi:hypothetical protein
LKKTSTRVWLSIREGLKLKNSDAERCCTILDQSHKIFEIFQNFTPETSEEDVKIVVGKISRDSKGDSLAVLLLASILGDFQLFEKFTRLEFSLKSSDLLNSHTWKPLINGKELIEKGK